MGASLAQRWLPLMLLAAAATSWLIPAGTARADDGIRGSLVISGAAGHPLCFERGLQTGLDRQHDEWVEDGICVRLSTDRKPLFARSRFGTTIWDVNGVE